MRYRPADVNHTKTATTETIIALPFPDENSVRSLRILGCVTLVIIWGTVGYSNMKPEPVEGLAPFQLEDFIQLGYCTLMFLAGTVFPEYPMIFLVARPAAVGAACSLIDKAMPLWAKVLLYVCMGLWCFSLLLFFESSRERADTNFEAISEGRHAHARVLMWFIDYPYAKVLCGCNMVLSLGMLSSAVWEQNDTIRNGVLTMAIAFLIANLLFTVATYRKSRTLLELSFCVSLICVVLANMIIDRMRSVNHLFRTNEFRDLLATRVAGILLLILLHHALCVCSWASAAALVIKHPEKRYNLDANHVNAFFTRWSWLELTRHLCNCCYPFLVLCVTRLFYLAGEARADKPAHAAAVTLDTALILCALLLVWLPAVIARDRMYVILLFEVSNMSTFVSGRALLLSWQAYADGKGEWYGSLRYFAMLAFLGSVISMILAMQLSEALQDHWIEKERRKWELRAQVQPPTSLKRLIGLVKPLLPTHRAFDYVDYLEALRSTPTEETKRLHNMLESIIEIHRLQHVVHMKTLLELDVYVLDNTLRETSVAQVRGHTCSDKMSILDSVSTVGFEDVIVAAFGTLKRVDDDFAQQALELFAEQDINAFCFSNMWNDVVDKDPVTGLGTPDLDLPLGLERALEYGVPHVILELDVVCKSTDWIKFSVDKLLDLIDDRIEWVRDNLPEGPQTRIFINYRDFPAACNENLPRVLTLTHHLASYKSKIMGIIFEDPSGGILPFEFEHWVSAVREVMESSGWKSGHLLCHVHHNYGLAQASVMSCLYSGCTGIWCGVCREGAAVGHASSCVTLANLARLGNAFVPSKYDLPALMRSAVEVTKVVSGEPPHPMTEVYGRRATDLCFDGMGMGLAGGIDSSLAHMMGRSPHVRLSTLATDKMVAMRLADVFGGDWEDYDEEVCAAMRLNMHEKLRSGTKEENDSASGLLRLYELSGGEVTPTMASIVLDDSDISDSKAVRDLKAHFEQYMDEDGKVDKQAFYDGFMAAYISCEVCDIADAVYETMDIDEDGMVSWDEILVRATWAVKEYPHDSRTADGIIGVIFERILLPHFLAAVEESGVTRTRVQTRVENRIKRSGISLDTFGTLLGEQSSSLPDDASSTAEPTSLSTADPSMSLSDPSGDSDYS